MDPLVFTEVGEARGDVSPLNRGQVAIFSARSPDKESPNEDAAAVVPAAEHAAVLVVADGMGGSPAGQRASALAVEEMVAALREAAPDEPNLRAAVLNGIENANRAICELGVGAASTLAVAEVWGDTVRPYHVGDSMILVVGQRGKVKLQTVSHSPVGYAVEAGLVERKEALFHEDLHLVSNLLGTPEMHIEMGPLLKLAPRDTVLVSSDGLTDNLHRDEIAGIIRKGPLADANGRLARLAASRMRDGDGPDPSKEDDLTVVLFRLAR